MRGTSVSDASGAPLRSRYATALPLLALGALALAILAMGAEDTGYVDAGLASCAGCEPDFDSTCGPGCAPTEVSYGLVAADFSGNGFASIVQTSTLTSGHEANPGRLKSWLSKGRGSFSAPVLTGDGNDPVYLATADLNADRLPDVVSASMASGVLAVFLNEARTPGTFRKASLLPSPGVSQVAVADMNGDSLPDLIAADSNVSLFLQVSPGVFGNPIALYPAGASWVAVGDLNGDGIPDVALTDHFGLKVLFHTGAASRVTYAAPVPLYGRRSGSWIAGANLIAIADIDGDGLQDLVITDPGPDGGSAPTVAVLLQNAAKPGTFQPAVSYPTAVGSLAQSIQIVDLDRDGHPDIVVGGSGAVSVILQRPHSPGTFTATTNYAVSNANQIAVVDVNGDGLPDIIVSNGPKRPVRDGTVTNEPGVLLQVPARPGTFTNLRSFP